MARNKYDVDETLETKFDMKQIKRLFSYVGRYRKKLIMTIMLMLFSSALGMVIPVLMQRVMDIYIPNHDKKGILLMTGGNCGEKLQEYLSIPTKMFFDCINTEYCGKAIIGNLDNKLSFEADFSHIFDKISDI